MMNTKPTNDLRRLGTILALGMVAGFGARYVMSRTAARQPARPVDTNRRLVNWDQARSIAVRVSQWEQAPVHDRAARRAQYASMVEQSVPMIAQYMGVDLPQPVSRLYVADRRDWLLANFDSFEQLFAPVEELYAKVSAQRGGVNAAIGGINGRVLGAQMGVLIGFLSKRVLGQYDLSLLSPDTESQGALYFVEPNIAKVQTQLGLNDADFRLWIALHETTHVFQFEAFPWVRPYFNELLRQFLDQMSDQMASLGVGVGQIARRLLSGRGSGKHWIEQMLTPEQQRVFDRMQALMSIVEGYSTHVMNTIGEQMLPSFQQIEQRMEQRKGNRPLLEELFNRITGMDLKLSQYQQGEQFIDAVVAARGLAFANRVWEKADNIPTMTEIRNPQAWIARMEG
ncbi:MAG TPA: zinc-dependent metalloprotease [Roseiflexaceae bacterium]|nr:zinc-dependent metalloprotease [Roseiflexaceae bacterium]